MRDFKYLLAYLLPFSAFIGFYFRGYLSGGSVYLAFIIIPLLELMLPVLSNEVEDAAEDRKANAKLFDYLLYMNVPLLYALLGYYLYVLHTQLLSVGEIVGITINMGVVLGAMGINLAHELGHRKTRFERVLAKLMLLPALYMHFTIEHNRGHHKYVATPKDPATSRKGETLYFFWWRSIKDSWLHAWQLEGRRLEKEGLPFWSVRNEMIQIHLLELTYVVAIFLFFGMQTGISAVAAAFFGIILLETVNYIEHYGLLRQRLPSGRYEKVQKCHSWNSNHELGRIFLYELTRHADHHYKASRKYQILRHFEESPQLPLGYPASMLVALVPPLWFRMMDSRVEAYNRARNNFVE